MKSIAGPLDRPTKNQTNNPTDEPTNDPTGYPAKKPTTNPSELPTRIPTTDPTDRPSGAPIANYQCCQAFSERYERRCNLLEYIDHCESRYHQRRCTWDQLQRNCSTQLAPDVDPNCYCTHSSIGTRKRANSEATSQWDICQFVY